MSETQPAWPSLVGDFFSAIPAFVALRPIAILTRKADPEMATGWIDGAPGSVGMGHLIITLQNSTSEPSAMFRSVSDRNARNGSKADLATASVRNGWNAGISIGALASCPGRFSS